MNQPMSLSVPRRFHRLLLAIAIIIHLRCYLFTVWKTKNFIILVNSQPDLESLQASIKQLSYFSRSETADGCSSAGHCKVLQVRIVYSYWCGLKTQDRFHHNQLLSHISVYSVLTPSVLNGLVKLPSFLVCLLSRRYFLRTDLGNILFFELSHPD